MNWFLNWDIVLLSIFGLFFVFYILAGVRLTMRFLFSLYLALFFSDGVLRLLQNLVFVLESGSLDGSEKNLFLVLRVLTFLGSLFFLLVRGIFSVSIKDEYHWGWRWGFHFLLSFFTTGFFLGSLLLFISDHSFLEGLMSLQGIDMFHDSGVAKLLVYEYPAWVCIPTVVCLVSGFFPKQS